ncbi:MAG: F0F1 ATP synthase subunit B, partial [Actinomycetota bacterium]|nr:F0F1 ATP synthase subunit B [Actinomycetota bacterium]
LAAEGKSGIDLILPGKAELIWGTVCFVIVAVVLTRIAFPKIREVVEQRESTIQNALETAERSNEEAQRRLDEYKQQLAEARSEANRIIEEARLSADQVRKDLVAKAEKDAEGIVARAQEQIEAERNRTVQELRGTIRDLTIDLAEKVVGRSLDANSQRDLVDAYIAEVGTMGNGSNN